MGWMLLPLKRYAEFSGRSRRKEFWLFFLFQMLVQFAWLFLFIGFVVLSTNGFDPDPDDSGSAAFIIFPLIYAAFWLAMLIPNVALVTRRFHDQNINGMVGVLLYIATVFLTFPGLIILVFMAIEGKKGENQYGEDPKLITNIGQVFS